MIDYLDPLQAVFMLTGNTADERGVGRGFSVQHSTGVQSQSTTKYFVK
jgi:hypothetical protein